MIPYAALNGKIIWVLDYRGLDPHILILGINGNVLDIGRVTTDSRQIGLRSG